MNEGSWQPDPTHRHELRWWDGQAWTDHVSDYGITSIDPPTYVATEPTAAPPPSSWGAPAPVPGQGFGSQSLPSSANDDTVHRSTAIQPPPVGSALPESLVPQFTNEPAAAAPKSNTGLIVAGIVAVLAVGAIAFFLFSGGGDDDVTNPTDPTAITGGTDEPITTDPTTTGPTTTMETTTTVAPVNAALLLASLPTAGEVPAGWVQTGATSTDPPELEGPGIGLCGGDNLISVARVFGSGAQVDGPVFEIPDGGTLSIDAFAFPDAEAASAFLSATGGIINECVAPVVFQLPESEIDLLNDGTGDAAVWDLVESGSAGFGETTTVDERLGTVVDTAATTTADTGVAYSLTYTDLSRYERSGNMVVKYTLRGYHTYGGGDPPSAYLPTTDDISVRVEALRPAILAKLADNGFL